VRSSCPLTLSLVSMIFLFYEENITYFLTIYSTSFLYIIQDIYPMSLPYEFRTYAAILKLFIDIQSIQVMWYY